MDAGRLQTGTARRFRLQGCIGKGGFGEVYLAEMSTSSGFVKTVAVKVLREDVQGHEQVASRLRDEARLLGLLRHPAIVRADDLITLAGRPAVVMEYVPGVNLSWLINPKRNPEKLPPTVTVAILRRVASALEAAYSQISPSTGQPLKVMHRDIKPGNIRITADGEVKVLDFGIARSEHQGREADTQNYQLGSLRYMSPELMSGRGASHASDVYALGVVAFETLARKRLGWAAERMTDTGYVYDAVAVHTLDDEAPWEGEDDFWSTGEATNGGIALLDFDLVANSTYWATASAWMETYDSLRTIQLDGVNATSHVHGSYRAESAWTMPFDQLQASLSTAGNIIAIGCGLAGAGLHAVQYSVANLTAGTGGPGADAALFGSSDDHDVCEYDHYAYQFDTFTSDGMHLDYYILSGGTLTPSSSSTGTWLAQDFELTTENGFLVMALADLSSGYGFLFQLVDLGSASQGSYWSTSPTALRSIDASVSPSGVAYGCGVDDAGTAYLLWSDILEIASPVLNTTALHAADLTTVEDCAITVTADSVAVIALRGGDDIAYASLLVP